MEHYGISVEPERRSTLPTWDSGYESRLIYSEDVNMLFYGSDTGWVTVSGGGGGGTSVHSLLSGLAYASAGHTGFSPTIHTHTESNISDLDKYTESEVDTISGTLSSEIDSDISTHTSNSDAHHNESHTVVSHSDTTATGANLNELVGSGDTTLHRHDDRYYTESEVDNLITTISGKLDDHNELNNLDYASAGHTGFQASGDYATDAELTTVSGDLQTNIDGKSDSGHTHDDRYYTESEVDTISGTLNEKISEYETIYIDAAEMIPCTTSGALQGTTEYSTNDIDIDHMAFDAGTTEERAQFTYSMPDNWDRGTIRAKFIWSSAIGSTTGDTVEWGIRAVAGGNDDTIDADFGTPQVISDALLADNGAKRQTTGQTAALTIAGTPVIGDEIQFEIYRNTDGTDNMAEDGWLFKVALQIKLSGAVPVWT